MAMLASDEHDGEGARFVKQTGLTRSLHRPTPEMAARAALSKVIGLQIEELAHLLKKRPTCPDVDDGWWFEWDHADPELDRWGVHDNCYRWLGDVARFAEPFGAGTAGGAELARVEAVHHVNSLAESGRPADEPLFSFGRGPSVQLVQHVAEAAAFAVASAGVDAYLVLVDRTAPRKQDWIAAWETLPSRRRTNGHEGRMERPQRALVVAQWLDAGLSPEAASARWDVRTSDDGWAKHVPPLERAAHAEWRAAGGDPEQPEYFDPAAIEKAVDRIKRDLERGSV